MANRTQKRKPSGIASAVFGQFYRISHSPFKFFLQLFSRKIIAVCHCKFSQRTAGMCGAGGRNVITEGRLEVLSVLLRCQLSTDMMSVEGGFEAGCRVSAGSVRLRTLTAEHLELPSACSGTFRPPAPRIPASV